MESKQNSEEFLRIRKSFAKHLLAEWGLRIIFINVLGLNKKGPNPSAKMVMKTIKPKGHHLYIKQTHRPLITASQKTLEYLQLHWHHQRNHTTPYEILWN